MLTSKAMCQQSTERLKEPLHEANDAMACYLPGGLWPFHSQTNESEGWQAKQCADNQLRDWRSHYMRQMIQWPVSYLAVSDLSTHKKIRAKVDEQSNVLTINSTDNLDQGWVLKIVRYSECTTCKNNEADTRTWHYCSVWCHSKKVSSTQNSPDHWQHSSHSWQCCAFWKWVLHQWCLECRMQNAQVPWLTKPPKPGTVHICCMHGAMHKTEQCIIHNLVKCSPY